MRSSPLIFKDIKLTSKEISNFLTFVDGTFKPNNLSSRVNIESYSEKLSKLATHFSCWSEGKLVGICCFYVNNKNAYFSVAAVDPAFAGKGIGTDLLMGCIKQCKEQNCKTIEAEVDKENLPSLKMVKKIGFLIYKSVENSYFIRLELE